MKDHSLFPYLAALLMVFLLACDKEEKAIPKRLKLESIGFAGTLPDGRNFGNTGVVASNSVGASSSTDDGSYVRHELSILDPITKINITLALPHLKYSNNFIMGSEGDGTVIKQTAREFYPYQLVKEKLAVGSKLLVSSQNPYSTNTFRVQVNDNIHYNNFICDAGDQTGSYLKVTELVEGTETDPALGTIKTLEVVFDLDVKMYPANKPKATPLSKLKGLLRMKYRQI